MLRDTLAGRTGRHIEQVEVTFRMDVSTGKIQDAWNSMVAATEAMHSGFLIIDGEPRGLVACHASPSLAIEAGHPACWDSWLEEDRLQTLPLDGGPPWRARFFPTARKLVWTFHHALLDGRSISRILHHFLTRLKQSPDPGKLTLSRWSAPDEITIARAVDFHRAAFSGLEPFIPEYPLDSARKPSVLQRILGSHNAACLEAAAHKLEVTAATMITWAWGQALAATSGAEAVAIGQVRAGPPHPGQAGFTMNTVPLVIRRSADGDLASAMLDLRQRLLAMREIETVSPQDLPADVFQIAGGPWPGGTLMVERGTLAHQTGIYQEVESIRLHERAGNALVASAYIHPELELTVETDGGPIGPQAAEHLLDHWAQIITALAGEPSESLTDLTRFPARMEERIDSWENGGPALANTHLSDIWQEAAREFAGRCAIWTPDRQLTYAELDARAGHLAARLRDAGIRHGSPVANRLRDRGNLPLALLGIMRAGGIHVPIDPLVPLSRHHQILADSGAALVLTDDPPSCTDYNAAVLGIEGESATVMPDDIPFHPDDALALLYTSGSTGTPKGVIMTHGGVINEALAIAKIIRITPGDRFLQFSSPGFDTSLEELLSTLISGATVVPRPDEIVSDFSRIHSFLRDAEITILDLTTTFWAAWCAWMVAEKTALPETLRSIVVGGERLSAAAVRDWMIAGGDSLQLVNSYGPTEASVVVTVEEITTAGDGGMDPPIGRPLPGVIARVAGPSGRRLPPGAAGELWLGGRCVSPGYWGQPDLTAVSFPIIGGIRWYRTGDRVHWDDTGRLHFLGRCDDQLKIRGQRIEPGEIIRVLESHPGVSAAHAGPHVRSGNTMLAAWLRWKDKPPEDWPALLADHAATRLPAAAIPVRWAAVEEFKLTERGKLDRKALPEPLLTASRGSSSAPPATPVEQRIAEIWDTLLDTGPIGRDESFFELGGHSLAALRLFALISREWGVRIPMATLIEAPTPRSLAERIGHLMDAVGNPFPHGPVVVPVRAEGNQPPLFCIHGGDGGVIFYRDLAAHLPAGRPLLAIESPALGADEEVRMIPVEHCAASYIEALRSHQPQGPYHLAGYSYGGLLVYEMARQLRAMGESVAFAGLFDTVNPAIPMREYSLLERAEVCWNTQQNRHWLQRTRRLLTRVSEGLATHFRVRGEIRAARSAGSTPPHSDIRMLQVREAHWQAMMIYQPQPLDCHITLFRTETADDKFEIPEDYGWTGLVKSLEIVGVSGQHLTMFAPRNAATLATEIHRRL